MPLNLAESALSVAKLGENNLAAMYLGEERIYPNVVTVSLDGGQSQTGTPGQPMTPFTWSISSTDTANYGFTTANESAATLTGLPSGWVGTYANSAGSIPTTGTWSITTVDGNFPTTSINILTSSLTRNNPETGFGTLSVTFTGNSTFQGISGTYSGTAFIGSTATAGATAPTTSGNTGLGCTDIGYVMSSFWSGSISTTVSGGTASISGVGNTCISVSTSVTIGAIGTVSGTSTYTCGYATGAQTPSRTVLSGINAPPWQGGTSDGPQALARSWYAISSDPVDSRASYQLRFDMNGGTYTTPTIYGLGVSSGFGGWQSFSVGGTGSGTYTVELQSTYGSRPENPVFSTALSNGSGYGCGPVTSNMT